jgi:hypothetical protein
MTADQHSMGSRWIGTGLVMADISLWMVVMMKTLKTFL